MSTLAQLALKKIRYSQVPDMTVQQKTVIHYEIYSNVFWSRSIKGKRLYNICHCPNFGRCLCYLEIIRQEMTGQYWAPEARYEFLSGWYSTI